MIHRFVMARNYKGRPTLMHAVARRGHTLCGQNMTGWSRNWFDQPILGLLCKRCRRLM